MTSLRRLTAPCAVALLIASVMLTACAMTGEPAAEAAPEPAPPTASPSPTAASLPVPQPATDLDCAALLPDGLGPDVLGVALPPAAAVDVGLDAPAVQPTAFATRQTGGLYCETTNGEPYLVDSGLSPAYVGVHLRIVPGGAATPEWPEYLASSPLPDQEPPIVACSVGEPISSCRVDTIVDDAWVTADFYGVDAATIPAYDLPPSMRAVFDDLVDRISGASEAASGWSPPTATAVLTQDCEEFFGLGDFAARFGITEETYFGPYEDYSTSERAGRALAPALSCPWTTESRFGTPFGAHSWLQGGEWALNETIASGALDDFEPMTVAGLSDDDRAMMSCSGSGDACVLHVVVAHDWVTFTLDLDEAQVSTIQARRLVISLAEEAVAVIRG